MPVMDWLAERSVAWQMARARAIKKAGDLTLRDKELFKLLGWRLPGDSALSDPYQQLSIVYACITIKARNIANVPFKLYHRTEAAERLNGRGWREKMALVRTKAAEGSEITSGAPWIVFQRPNSTQSRYQFWESLFIDLDASGEWFVWKDRAEVDAFPVSLWRRAPAKIGVATTNNVWSGWKYTSGTEVEYYTVDEVLHDKYAHPSDDLRGLSPLTPLKIAAEAMYDAIRWNRAFFKNNATPDIAYTTDKELTSTQRKELTHALQAARENMTGAHKSLLLEGGLKPQLLGYTQRDMQFGEMMRVSKEDVCMALNVPKSVLSMYEDANYAFALSADRGFWTETLIPLMTRCEDEFNRGLLKDAGIEGYFDLQAVDALNYAWMDKIDAAVKLWNMQFTANEINERLNLGFEEEPWRDHPFEGMGYPPEDEEAEPTTEPVETPPQPEGEPTAEEQDEEEEPVEAAGPGEKAAVPATDVAEAMKERRWRETMGKIRPLVGRFNRALKNYWYEVERKVMDRITKYVDPKTGGIVAKGITADNLDDLDGAFNDEALMRLSRSYIEEGTKVGVTTEWKGDFKLVSQRALARAGTRVGRIVGINERGLEDLKESIKDLITESVTQGYSEKELARMIFEEAKGRLTDMEHRARWQARTEVHGAYAEGRWEGMKQSGASAKMWITARDEKVRDTHEAMDGATVKFEESFEMPSGVTMQFPLDPDAVGDDQAVASEQINCRCCVVAEYEDENGEVTMEPPEVPTAVVEPELVSFREDGDVPADIWWRENVATEKASAWWDDLAARERSVLLGYKGSEYHSINNSLRLGGEWVTASAVNDIAVMDEVFARALPTDGKSFIVYRGMSASAYKKMFGEAGARKGKVIVDKAFVSTSVRSRFASQWKSSHVVEIEVPAGEGRAVLLHPKQDKEYELLLNRGQKFRVTGRGTVPIGRGQEVKVVRMTMEPQNVAPFVMPAKAEPVSATKAKKERAERFVWEEDDFEVVEGASL